MSDPRGVRRAGILSKTLSLEGPAFLTLFDRMPLQTPKDDEGSATFTAAQHFSNCFQAGFLIRIPSGPLLEFNRFEEA
jgi:hypothetical protein